MSFSTPAPLSDSAPYTAVPRGERTVVLPFLITIALFAITTYLTLCPPSLLPLIRIRNRTLRLSYRLTALLPSLPPALAFLSLSEPNDLAVAVASFASYFAAQSAALNAKHRAYYAQPAAHRALAVRLGWVARLREVERCAEANGVVAGELAGLGMERAREWGVPVGGRSRWERKDGRVVEVLKHFVRDWSEAGASERAALFPPILSALATEFPSPSPSARRAEHLKVLVPGCGLGRLAYEIARLGFAVDANDFSHFMSLGSELVFTRAVEVGQFEVHPYIHNFSHQRTVEGMTRGVRFPDVVPRLRERVVEAEGEGEEGGLRGREGSGVEEARAGTPPPPPSPMERTASGKPKLAPSEPSTAPDEDDDAVDIRFVHGDFLTEFPHRSTHHAIVTLFFIDTAANLTAYLQQIYHSLKPGGIWVNLGPLLYYGNPAMELPLDLVLELARLVGFEEEGRMGVRDAEYTADGEGMYSFRYHCEGWVMRKPRARVLVIRDE